MDMLYCPWRQKYVKPVNSNTTQAQSCVFCTLSQQNHANDSPEYILKRTDAFFIVLNRYPYNAGHILVVPHQHIKSLESLAPDLQHELIDLICHTQAGLHQIIKPHGINIGVNIGKAAGAGIPDHLHAHVLPRWNGDTNFLPTLGKTKQISIDLDEVYGQLRPFFEQ